ncbi:MAG: hypothetical protein ACI8ZB_005028 [Desulforhopalus sp.]|jgi:hypothetical protein
MTISKSKLASPEEAYITLDPTSKAILQLLAVNVDYCRLSVVIRCLGDLHLVDVQGRPFTLDSLQALLDDLTKKGLLVKNSRGHCCSEFVRHLAFHDTLMQETFSAQVECLQKFHPLPIQLSSAYYHRINYQQLLRDFQIALFYQGSLEEVRVLAYEYAYLDFNEDYYDNNPFLMFLNRPFSPDIIEKIEPSIRSEILIDLLSVASSCLDPSHDILAYINDRYSRELSEEPFASYLLYHNLIIGDTDKIRQYLSQLNDGMQLPQLVWTGCLEVVSGRYQEGCVVFTQSNQLLKKVVGKRKVFLENYAGIFQLLALLQIGETSSLQEGLDYINIAEKNKYSFAHVTGSMAPVFYEKLGKIVPERFVQDHHYFLKNPVDIFFISLFRFWRGGKTIEDISLLQQTRDKALNNGYIWLAAEISALLAALGNNRSTNQETAARLHASCKTISCVDIVRLQPQWEKTLNALLHLSEPSKEKKGGTAEQRLIWWFSFSKKHQYCHIVPRLQKMSAKGTWTKGRAMALKTLYRDYPDMEGLTDQDRQVCRAIKEESFRSGWRGYGQKEYFFNPDLALPALVGHPQLFLEESPEVNVELVLAEPELHIKKQKGGLKLIVTPSFSDESASVFVEKDTPTRYKIIRFTAEHRQLINLLGKGMTIPKSGEDLARQAVEAISPLITVHSDLEGGTNRAKSLQADCRPHAHILPYRDGVSLEFLVKPIAAGHSSFTPGKGSKTMMAVADGKSVQTVRDLTEEKQLLARVIGTCSTLNRLEAINNQWQVDDPEESLELLLELKDCGDDIVMEWPQGEKMKVRSQASAKSFSLRIGKDRDWFKATGALTIDDTLTLDLRKLLEMLGRSTGRFIPLDDGTYLAITSSLHKRLAELNAYSEGHGEGVRFAPLAALALEDLTGEAGQLKSDKAWKDHCKRLAETATPSLPSTLQAELRDYQTTGFRWLARLSSWGVGACLADDMGLGKTVQALAAILLRASQGPTLVVAPLSVTSNWQEEASRFAPTLNVIVFGPGDRRQMIDNLQAFDLLVVSYGLLPLEAELLASVSWQTVVLDEAQAIKNMQTKRSKAAMGLRAECRIITTGTPLENHLGELWTLFNFLNPGLLGSFKKFNEKFAVPIERDQDAEARNHLRKLIRPFILRRLKRDVLQELPAKTEITLEVEMSPEEELLYEAQRQKALENISEHQEEEAGPQHLRILAELMKLRRLCCNPLLILPDSEITSSKLRVFSDTLHDLLDNNHKALVFSQFVDHLGIIRQLLDEENISYQYLDGSTPIKQRKQRVNDFQNGKGDVFLISLKAGGAGLNLTAADYVIHMDPWWNPAVEDQASDRAHRIGQDRPVTVYRLVMKDTIEQQIVKLHKQKRDLADSLLEGTDAAGKISAKELLALLHKEKME